MPTVPVAPPFLNPGQNPVARMSDSLKDQLRALGLATGKTGYKHTKPHSASKKAAGTKGSEDISLNQAYRMRDRQERQQQERASARKREQERQRKEVNRKVRSLVKVNAVRDEAADRKRNFLYKGRIRSVLATAEQLREINTGKLGVVYLSGSYHLMSAEKVAEVRQFAPDHVPDLQGADGVGEEDHPVPDDLIW